MEPNRKQQMAQAFQKGDRVQIKRGAAEHFIQPFRRFGESGRIGTVIGVFGTALREEQRDYFVRFDALRKGGREHGGNFSSEDLEPSHD